MNEIIQFIENYLTIAKKLRKEFRKAMGKKTIKIDGLQHFKLMLLKAKLNKEYQKNATLGDIIEFLCDNWSKEHEGK